MYEGPKLKVKRAKKHIRELMEVLETYIKSDFCRFAIKKDQQTGAQIFVAEIIKDNPCEIPLIIGDAIHNLRSALDILISDVIRNNGEAPTKYTKFPFRETRQELIDAINGGLVETIGDVMMMAIVDSVRPYRQGGDNTLCALHDIDIDDKHFLIIPIVRATSVIVSSLRWEEAGRAVLTMKDCTVEIGSRGEVEIVGGMAGNYKFEGDLKPTFDIFFQDGGCFGGQPVIPTLHQIAELIDNVITFIGNVPTTHGASPL